MGEYAEAIKQHFNFRVKEARDIVIAIFLLALIFAFDDGAPSFSAAHWIGNYILFAILVSLALLFRIGVQKLVAIKVGYRTEFKIWNYGLVLGVVIAFLSRGNILLLLPGGLIFFLLPAERLGHFRYGLNYDTTGTIAASGSLANMLLGMFTKALMYNFFGFESAVLDKFIFVNFLLAFFMMLPIPPLDGIRAFFGGRLTYVFIFGIILAYVALFLVNIFSLIFAVLIGIVLWLVYYFTLEKGYF
ncbi:MAG: hypothetical protein GXP63_01280 [DPANN group archaeon]|nr:hypothetical protein [DPANN group archaeon]